MFYYLLRSIMQMSKSDHSVAQIITAIKKQQRMLDSLQESLMTRAQLQEYTEKQFNALVEVARHGIELVEQLNTGDIVTQQWVDRRNELVEMACRLIQDT
jgi:hypothetical protein